MTTGLVSVFSQCYVTLKRKSHWLPISINKPSQALALPNQRYSWHNTHCRRHFTYLTTLSSSSSQSDDNAKLLPFCNYCISSLLLCTSLHIFTPSDLHQCLSGCTTHISIHCHYLKSQQSYHNPEPHNHKANTGTVDPT